MKIDRLGVLAMVRCFTLLMLIVGLSGCASTIETLTSRGVMSDHLNKPHDRNKMRTQTGDRRAIYFLERQEYIEGKLTLRLVVCAEPFAGAMTVRGASSSLSVTGSGEAKDAVTATIQAVDARAAAVRLFEDVEHAYCKRYQDGSITGKEYLEALKSATNLAFAAIGAKPPAATESGPSTLPGRSTPP
ncbi:hypothetical protein [Novosphingobium lindaniclasticum]|uniref:hypothetical protein n=1 Tax=Novosphingobium lindaniclasticum TaxID=1329895 RepID=UPI0012689EAD|nr:hypothetical protein [Novosphingobium lindaniclasticum]